MKLSRLVPGVLLSVWALVLLWQFVEHNRVRQTARVELINRARDVSTTLGLVMRSQRRFGVISKERIESALTSLVSPGVLNAIALLNNAGEVVASAGDPIDFGVTGLVPTGEHWGPDRVTLVNLVDLGDNVPPEPEDTRPTLILPRTNMFSPFGTNRAVGTPSGRPPPPAEEDRLADTNAATATTASGAGDTNEPPRSRGWQRGRGGDRRMAFGRPFWMSEAEYRSVVEKQGVHSFVVVLSARPMLEASGRDLWLRGTVTLFASFAVVGLALAWRSLLRSSELEVRLARASELNARLKEMNLAAAGLAHETRNPLNIIRGLAQMISRQDEAAPPLRQKSREIIDEADRVTAQLNEFINYSRPREVRRSLVPLTAAVVEVKRALVADLEEKTVSLDVAEDLPVIEADEQLLRQTLFNLLLNAIQAADRGGRIEVAAARTKANEVDLEIRDNGPGVPAEHRADIFKPYFTTHTEGTGLGLAVVQQIVLADGWEIECLPNHPRGAVFRISHVHPASEVS